MGGLRGGGADLSEAEVAQMDPELAESIWRRMFEWFITREENLFDT